VCIHTWNLKEGGGGVRELVEKLGWEITQTLTIPPRKPEYVSPNVLNVNNITKKLLETLPQGLYFHQALALEEYMSGKNVCITTGTASGKTTVFHTAALEELSKDPGSRILAVYPLKALIVQQLERWREALERAGLSNIHVESITGDTSMDVRSRVIASSKILLMTPDTIHSWMMYKVSDPMVKHFLSHLKLLIADEVHAYAGVFGSNAAFLFRRLFHALHAYGSSFKIVAASATIAEPHNHLMQLFGRRFEIVGEDSDSSPRNLLKIHFIKHPDGARIEHLKNLLEAIVEETDERFMVFMDSRKQVELLATTVNRGKDHIDDDVEDPINSVVETFEKYEILPFRSGYEENDRQQIQERLENGSLRGIICTSALELGLDIPHLTMGILVGVPRSSTSFKQRIGRIGRKKEGTVMVIKTSDSYNDLAFSEPERILKLPPMEGALYLQNRRLQYVHALCFARSGGEYDQVCEATGHDPEPFHSPIDWPEGFLELCEKERAGDIPEELQLMKAESQDDPNHYYPLRDVDMQFQLVLKAGGKEFPKGHISYEQLMREAYPGAVYYYAAQPFRVCYVDVRNHRVILKKEKHYTTTPLMLPSMVYPRFSNPIKVLKRGQLLLAETNLQIRTIIQGFVERRGPNKIRREYPITEDGIVFHQSNFTRFFFTTGVIIHHPDFDNVPALELARILHLAFHSTIPLEAGDTGYAVGRTKAPNAILDAEERRYVVLYDETYGSLRLTSKLVEDDVIVNILTNAVSICEKLVQQEDEDYQRVLTALKAALEDAENPPQIVDVNPESGDIISSERYVQIIKPGSVGIRISDNAEVKVIKVFYSPKGLIYEINTSELQATSTKIPVGYVQPLEGESELAYYDLENGEVLEDPTGL